MKAPGLAALASLALAAAHPATARDANGAYAIKGVGQLSCEDYTRAREAQATQIYAFAGWLDGYLTGFNHFQADTYDLAPWQTTEIMLAMIAKHCGQNPGRSFTDAANDLALIFYPDRLEAEAGLVRVENAGRAVFMYEPLVEEVRTRLAAAGHPAGEPGTPYGRAFADAVKTFQAKRGLTVSGLPDQPTMSALFLE